MASTFHRSTVLPEFSGERVTLRTARPDDVIDRLKAGRDPEFRRMVGAVGTRGPLIKDDAERWYIGVCSEPYTWVIEYEGRWLSAQF